MPSSSTVPYFRHATPEDAVWLASRLRKADLQEIQASTGEEPEDALLGSLERSEIAYTILHDGAPVAIFGVGRLGADVGAPWMVATDELVRMRGPFLRHAKTVLGGIQAIYPLLVNYVDARNEVHIRWLRRLGFTFINKHDEFGAERRPFFEFVRLDRV